MTSFQPNQPIGVPPNMPKSTGNSAIVWILIGMGAMFLVGVGALVYILVMKPPASISAPTPPPNAPALTPATKVLGSPDVTIGADDLIQKYTQDEAGAVALYKDKIIEVTGQVFGKPEGALGGLTISIAGGMNRFRGVRATLAPENAGQFRDVTTGGVVTVRGRCDELTTNIELKDSAVLKFQPAAE